MKLTYRHTLNASYLGYITQAIINNLPPLLFVVFQSQFGLSLNRIGLLITVNFSVQIITDLLAAKFVDKIGYRICLVSAHFLCILGLAGMCILPFIMPPYPGLLIAISCNAVGGGLIEVLISPLVDSLPGEEKASAMSMLHSFYCWGHMGVVILSTLFFGIFDIHSWRYLPVIWAVIPLYNLLLFIKVPIGTIGAEGEVMPLRKLFSVKIFWLLFLMMVCSGASEQAMSQWSSLFAEAGLGVSKTLGDLLGPCSFALFMGLSRLYFGKNGSKLKLKRVLVLSGILCVCSYLLTVFSPIPILSLLGCTLCGLSVGIMWPGTYSLSAETYPLGGTAMFAILALAGDLGCSAGPGLVGLISAAVEKAAYFPIAAWFPGEAITQVGLKMGLLAAIVFPVLLLVGVVGLRRMPREV